jgi:putative aldouronate transport system permease protein
MAAELYRRAADMKKSGKKIAVFPIVNGIIFILLCLIILVPIWKILVDSFDLKTAYGMKFWPEEFGLDGYKLVFSNPTLYRPLLISVVTTICGTLMALALSTMGAYVLIQWDMPGRTFFANMLLFTMIFNGGMIPTYLVLRSLHLTNTLWVVILFPALNVYNLVLMRNFFEGIPASLFESATLDGCSPMQTFIRIVLPMSKAALASIGLMFAVSYWNDYTHYKLYITNSDLYNFQMKLRSMIMGSDLPTATGNATENTIKNAAIIIVIIPFMILYPMLQKYFVKGVNIGAVKE